MNVLLAGLIALQALAVPPLTPEQTDQLNTASDHALVLDEAGLYPLLYNAMGWKPGEEAGAVVPDYQAIRDKPAEERGRFFLIEGVFYRSQPVRNLTRRGPWDGKLQEWSISPDGNVEHIIVVYLVNGPDERDLPRTREHVRLTARFFKVWDDHDARGKLRSYPVFVGNSPEITGAPRALVNSPIHSKDVLWIALMVLAGAFVVVSIWRLKSNRAWDRQRQKRLEGIAGESPDDEGVLEEDEPLPEDPAEAMAEMERRRKAKSGRG